MVVDYFPLLLPLFVGVGVMFGPCFIMQYFVSFQVLLTLIEYQATSKGSDQTACMRRLI